MLGGFLTVDNETRLIMKPQLCVLMWYLPVPSLF
jgi:hypothetical protein